VNRLPFVFFFVSLFLCFLAGGTSVYVYWHLPESPKKPPLVMEPAVIDFGKVSDSERLTGKAVITNVSGKTVTIRDIHSSCVCSGVLLKKGDLPSGKSIELTAFMNTHGQSGKTAANILVLYLIKGKNENLPRALMLDLRVDVASSEKHTPSIPAPPHQEAIIDRGKDDVKSEDNPKI